MVINQAHLPGVANSLAADCSGNDSCPETVGRVVSGLWSTSTVEDREVGDCGTMSSSDFGIGVETSVRGAEDSDTTVTDEVADTGAAAAAGGWATGGGGGGGVGGKS